MFLSKLRIIEAYVTKTLFFVIHFLLLAYAMKHYNLQSILHRTYNFIACTKRRTKMSQENEKHFLGNEKVNQLTFLEN